MPASLDDKNKREENPKRVDAPRWIGDRQRRLERAIELLDANLGKVTWSGERDGLTVLVLTILSQNTTDPNALKGFTKLCETFPRDAARGVIRDPDAIPRLPSGEVDPVAVRLSSAADAFYQPDWDAIRKASAADVKNAIRVAGLPNSKGPAIQSVLEWLYQRSSDYLLEDAVNRDAPLGVIETLSAIKGVGEKTVSVTLIEAWGVDLCPVDTHVHRVVHRLGLIEPTSDRVKTFERLMNVMPKGRGFSFHHNLLTFGRTICKARGPACSDCFLLNTCPTGRVDTGKGLPKRAHA